MQTSVSPSTNKTIVRHLNLLGFDFFSSRAGNVSGRACHFLKQPKCLLIVWNVFCPFWRKLYSAFNVRFLFVFFFFLFVCKLFVKKTRNQKNWDANQGSYLLDCSGYQQWFLFVTLRLPFWISANVWLNTILDKCRLWEESMYFILWSVFLTKLCYESSLFLSLLSINLQNNAEYSKKISVNF